MKIDFLLHLRMFCFSPPAELYAVSPASSETT